MDKDNNISRLSIHATYDSSKVESQKFKYLPLSLRTNGYNYTQVSRGIRSCIYCEHVTSKIKYFEVFMIKIRPAEVLFGNSLPAREVYPSSESFGSTAWVYRSKEKAMKRFNDIENKLSLIKNK